MKEEVPAGGWSRWLKWTPKRTVLGGLVPSEPTKPTKPGFDGFVGSGFQQTAEMQSIGAVIKGNAVELYVANGDRLFIVADEVDAVMLGQPRGMIYTAAEVRRVIRISDPRIVAEVQEWKKQFNGTIR